MLDKFNDILFIDISKFSISTSATLTLAEFERLKIGTLVSELEVPLPAQYLAISSLRNKIWLASHIL